MKENDNPLFRFRRAVKDACKFSGLWKRLLEANQSDPLLELPKSEGSFLRGVRNITNGGGPLNNFRLLRVLLKETGFDSAELFQAGEDASKQEPPEGELTTRQAIDLAVRKVEERIIRRLDAGRTPRLPKSAVARRELADKLWRRVQVTMLQTSENGFPNSRALIFEILTRREPDKYLHWSRAMQVVDGIVDKNAGLVLANRSFSERSEWALTIGYQLAGLRYMLQHYWLLGKKAFESRQLVMDSDDTAELLRKLRRPFGMVEDQVLLWARQEPRTLSDEQRRQARLLVYYFQGLLKDTISRQAWLPNTTLDEATKRNLTRRAIFGTGLVGIRTGPSDTPTWSFPGGFENLIDGMIALHGTTSLANDADEFGKVMNDVLGEEGFSNARRRASKSLDNVEVGFAILSGEANAGPLKEELKEMMSWSSGTAYSFSTKATSERPPEDTAKPKSDESNVSAESESNTEGTTDKEPASEQGPAPEDILLARAMAEVARRHGTPHGLASPYHGSEEDGYIYPEAITKPRN